MPLLERCRHALVRRFDVVLVLVLATWLVWPVPLSMPLSQDHPLHLARAYLLGQSLADGHLSGWSSAWYFGFPVGELYPALADLVVVLLRACSLTLLPWSTCYALAFLAGYATIGLALCGFARAAGLSPWVGVVAAALCLLDPGTGREGGWRFTVFFGVWMHPLAVALAWWALGELYACVRAAELHARALVRPIVLAGLALLAHPGALPMIAMTLPLAAIAFGQRGRLARASVLAAIVGVGGAMLAAWWYAPMLAHKAWMAHFGTLWLELPELAGWVAGGQWAKEMPIAVGWTISAGLVLALVRGPAPIRFVAIASLCLWFFASVEAFTWLRLDLLSDGFRYLQYQRFVICAKPGLYLCAAWIVVSAAMLVRTRLPTHRLGYGALGVLVVAWSAWLVHGTAVGMRAGRVGEMQESRAGMEDDGFEAEWSDALAWAAARWAERDGFWRFAYATKSRHGHGVADAPVGTHAPAYKIGFTPGDNFIHRIEADEPEVLDRARVRYVVALDGRRGHEVARFGRIRVLERPVVEEVARLVGLGELEVVLDDPDGEGVVVDVRGTNGGRIEWNIAGHPRWELRRDGELVPWYEVPIIGDAAAVTPDERRAKAVRARQGDEASPRDPVLLAADAADGRWELRYRHVVTADVVGFALTIGVLVLFAIAWRRPALLDRLLVRATSFRDAWLVLAAIAILGALALRWQRGHRREATLASAWLRGGAAREQVGVRPGPLMVEHEIGPAIRVEAGPHAPASVVLADVPGRRVLDGWIAVDDPEVRLLRGEVRVVVSSSAAGDAWTKLGVTRVHKRAGRQPFTVDLSQHDAVDLRIEIVADAELPRTGFDVDLGVAPPR